MVQSAKKLLSVLLVATCVTPASAFSLLGPFDTWMTTEVGYALAGDGGGTMNLGEEYRLNTSTIVYGYDPSFLNYFGQTGVDAIEEAIKILNDLPAFSTMSDDLSEFPLDTRRYNFRALALGVRDIKSWALAYTLEVLGLNPPERYVWTLRAHANINNVDFFSTVRRSFDPQTLQPTPFVNGTLYTYTIVEGPPGQWEAVDLVVDPLAPSVSSVAGLIRGGGAFDARGVLEATSPGLFYTGLTRDDVGGLRYLYKSSNLNVENAVLGASSGFGAGGATLGGGSTGGNTSGAWAPVGGPVTGGTGTGTGTGAGTGAPAVPAVTNNFVDVALRPGPDKLRFIRAQFDSVLGQFTTNSISFTDTFLTNGVSRQQTLQRTLNGPDLIFGAGDLTTAQHVPIAIRRIYGFDNNSDVNTLTTGITVGPGTINPGVQVLFTKVGFTYLNREETGENAASSPGFVWGKFDGSTNAPVLFPAALSIEQVESAVSVQQGSGGASPWRLPQ
jgi:hypothetical protein